MAAVDSLTRPAERAPTVRKVAPYLVDCDCHHLWHKIDDIFPYLPRQYVQEIKDFGSMFPNGGWTNMPNSHGYRTDHEVDEDTDFAEFTVREHLDRYDIDVAILTGQMVYPTVGMTNLDYAAAICRAHNDWTLDHWAGEGPAVPRDAGGWSERSGAGRGRDRAAGRSPRSGGRDAAGRRTPPLRQPHLSPDL